MATNSTVHTWSSWEAIVNSYQSFVEAGNPYVPMVEFCRQVASSRYAWGLYPAKSLMRLLIGQMPNFEWGNEVIQIEYLPKAERLRFDYWEAGFPKRHWSKECDPADGFGVLERLLRAKNWFVEETPVSESATGAV